MNQLLCNRTQRTLELNQNGILVNVFLDNPTDDIEISQLSLIKPYTYDTQAKYDNFYNNFVFNYIPYESYSHQCGCWPLSEEGKYQ